MSDRTISRFIAVTATILYGLVLYCLPQQSTAAEMLPMQTLNSYATIDNLSSNEDHPNIAADENGNYLAGWITPDDKVAVAYSNDGIKWTQRSTPASLYNPVPEYNICYIGQNKWALVWVNETLMASISNDLGESWSIPLELDSPDGVWKPFSIRDIAADGNGNLILLYTSVNTQVTDFRLMSCSSADAGQTWSSPIVPNLPPLSLRSALAQIAFAGNNDWLMAYRTTAEESGKFNIGVARSSDLGLNWTATSSLEIETNFQAGPDFDIKIASGMTVIAAHIRHRLGEQSTLVLYTSTDLGNTFEPPFVLDKGIEKWIFPPFTPLTVSLGADGNGHWVVAARVLEDTAPTPIKVWTSDDPLTTWTQTAEFGTSDYLDVKVASATAGEFVLLNKVYPPAPGLLANDLDIAAFTSTDAGSSWSEQQFVNPSAQRDMGKVEDLDVDIKAGNSIIMACWDSDHDIPNDLAYWQGYDYSHIMMSRSLDNGRSWEPAMPLPAAAGTRGELRFLEGAEWECYFDTINGVKKITSVDDGLSWSEPESTSRPSVPQLNLATGANGDLVRVRSQVEEATADQDSTIYTYCEISLDGGATWGDPTTLHAGTLSIGWEPRFRGEPQIIYLGEGNFAVLIKELYYAYDAFFGGERLLESRLILRESYDNGRTWSDDIIVNSGAGDISPRTPFLSSNGRVLIGWAGTEPMLGTGTLESDIFLRTKIFGKVSAAIDWQLFD